MTTHSMVWHLAYGDVNFVLIKSKTAVWWEHSSTLPVFLVILWRINNCACCQIYSNLCMTVIVLYGLWSQNVSALCLCFENSITLHAAVPAISLSNAMQTFLFCCCRLLAAAASVWNSLPESAWVSPSLSVFCSRLKTELFAHSCSTLWLH